MGKFIAFVAGALIPTAVAVHEYRVAERYKADCADTRAQYVSHVRDEQGFLDELKDGLKPMGSSVAGMVRTVTEALSASGTEGYESNVQGILDCSRRYRAAASQLRSAITERESALEYALSDTKGKPAKNNQYLTQLQQEAEQLEH